MGMSSAGDLSSDSPYERLRLVNSKLNQEAAVALEEGLSQSSNSPNPFEKLKSINKNLNLEYLRYKAERDRSKESTITLFAYGPRLLQFIVLLIVIFASVAYLGVLVKL